MNPPLVVKVEFETTPLRPLACRPPQRIRISDANTDMLVTWALFRGGQGVGLAAGQWLEKNGYRTTGVAGLWVRRQTPGEWLRSLTKRRDTRPEGIVGLPA